MRRKNKVKRAFFYRGSLIGALWGTLSYVILVVPAIRETIRGYLGYNMTYLLLFLPSAWVVPIFGNWDVHGFWGAALPLGASIAAGAIAGAFVGTIFFRSDSLATLVIKCIYRKKWGYFRRI
ncbi:hypothetical protein [Caldanaerobacter subterraneus]|uniref:hypothetical protein n=1 Tax=Caldanaerobacter subterraneus TaxID=911092 RepID=UPI0008E07F41|nr:hypothetical protein [Caldanaerobacter subterraneus]SFE71622.1 hypothetical protein SAMN04324257_02615 [Thermoanaerobacter thermohydrosulfuricus]